MNDLWLSLEDAPVGARCAHSLLKAILADAAEHLGRDNLRCDPDAVRYLTWDAEQESLVVSIGEHHTIAMNLNRGFVLEQHGGFTTLYQASGKCFTAAPATSDEGKLYEARKRSTEPPRPHVN